MRVRSALAAASRAKRLSPTQFKEAKRLFECPFGDFVLSSQLLTRLKELEPLGASGFAGEA
jgi:hypothetical protein